MMNRTKLTEVKVQVKYLALAIMGTLAWAILLKAQETLLFPGEEKHLKNVRMLTKGGENAEAYFSPDGKWIVWQGRWDNNFPADQIWIMPAEGGEPRLLSTGKGKTTCSFFVPGTDRIIYCSTHNHSPLPPPEPDRSAGYVWSLDEYDVYSVKIDGTDLRRLTETPGYDAEAAVSPDGKTIVFTSMRDGDLDIYTMDIDGGNVQRLTHTLGYDGGPFFSPDGQWIVFRSHLPRTEEEINRYRDLLSRKLVAPLRFEIQIMRPDGSERRQITNLEVASFAPYMHPDGKRIIFCSNYSGSPDAPENEKPTTLDNLKETGNVIKGSSEAQIRRMPVFNLFIINIDGTGLEQITFNPTFDGFPMFSNDGKKLIWCSNRFGPHPHSTNIFIADWIDP